MRKTIDLNRTAVTAEAKTFAAAVKTSDGVDVGAGPFTASGEKRLAGATLAKEDFTTSGGGKPPPAPGIAGDDFTASGDRKPPGTPGLTGEDFTASGERKPVR